jgi:DNA-binding transcriptional MerR regulator/methylmalonyl-CoA mutase cobalamin-binding subunit
VSSSDLSSSLRHPIGVVARRTGLKPDLIRAWERRYGAVAPNRSETRRRFYSDADIARLQLLRRTVETGRSIGQIANLANEELEALIAAEPASPGPAPASPAPPFPGEAAEVFLEMCLAAARRLDVAELELHLERASVALSRNNLLEHLVVPLLHRLGELWQRGELRPTHEHLASAVVRSFLGGMYRAYDIPVTAPHLLATTPPRQRHELGALIVAAVAAGEGWRVTYLGPDLPPEEIAAAAREKGARVVALSLVYPPDDPLLGDDLRRLRRLLPAATALIAGGRASPAYGAVLDEIGMVRADDLPSLRRELERLRGPETVTNLAPIPVT